jgi:drug/metabolite transporter (DMT)-like permease
MLAVVLALAAAASYSGSDYAAGLAARAASVVRVTLVAQVTNAVLIMPVVPLVGARIPSPPSLAWGALAGVSGAAGTIALYLGFRYAAFSVASTVSAVTSAGFSVLAVLLLGERPGALALAGIALALPAIAAVSVSTGQATTGQATTGQASGDEPPGAQAGGDDAPDPAGRPRRSATGRHAAGVGWGLVAGAAIGLFFTSLNRAGSGTDLWPLAVAELTAVVTVAGMAVATRQFGLPPAGTRWLSVLTGITAAAGTFCYFLATHRGLLAVTAVIASLYPAGTILLARALLGERLTAVRITGLCLAAASVALIAAAGAG